MNVLITSIGNKVNLLKYFRRALFNEGGGHLIGCDVDPLINGRFFVDSFERSPLLSDDIFKSWLLSLVQTKNIDLIIPSRDEDISALTDLKHYLKDHLNCRIIVPEKLTLTLCRDKSLFGKWCSENGFLIPKSFERDQVILGSLPLFLKPKIGSGSRGALLINDWQTWLSIRDDLNDEHMIQEFIDSPEYTIDLFVDISGSVIASVPRLRKVTLHGESICSQVELDDVIIRESKRLALALGLEGPNTIQCFKVKNRVVFSEVNPRFGGGFSLGVEAGLDSPRYLIREAKGLLAVDKAPEITNKLEMIRIQKDIFFSVEGTKIYCFDLDGTICTENCRYEDAQPMPFIVDKVNSLYDAGHTIIIATARGAASQRCWRKLIEEQLKLWGVKYHRLITDKPFADYYIDNKAVDILELF